MYTPTEFKDKRFQEIFDEERRKIKENDERMIKEHQDKIKALKEKGEYQEPTEQEIRDELHGYIYDTYKDVHGIKGRFFDYESMSTEEMHRVADELSEEIRISIAYERADDIYYKEQLEKARNTEGAIISKNPSNHQYQTLAHRIGFQVLFLHQSILYYRVFRLQTAKRNLVIPLLL